MFCGNPETILNNDPFSLLIYGIVIHTKGEKHLSITYVYFLSIIEESGFATSTTIFLTLEGADTL